MADRGKSMKKQRISPIKMVTVGMINRSISIRAAETWYCMVISALDEEGSIFLFYCNSNIFLNYRLWGQHLVAIIAAGLRRAPFGPSSWPRAAETKPLPHGQNICL
jgi:hypothetical protein